MALHANRRFANPKISSATFYDSNAGPHFLRFTLFRSLCACSLCKVLVELLGTVAEEVASGGPFPQGTGLTPPPPPPPLVRGGGGGLGGGDIGGIGGGLHGAPGFGSPGFGGVSAVDEEDAAERGLRSSVADSDVTDASG